MQPLHSFLLQIRAFGKKNFCGKFDYVFSDPECPFVFCVCDMLNAINIMLKERQGTFESFNCYSKLSVFSFMVVLLNFLKKLEESFIS